MPTVLTIRVLCLFICGFFFIAADGCAELGFTRGSKWGDT